MATGFNADGDEIKNIVADIVPILIDPEVK
jgi:hypothetical protein